MCSFPCTCITPRPTPQPPSPPASQPPHLHGRVAVLDIHSHGKFEPSDVESGGIPVGMAEDYTISTHYFISPAYHVHHFNMNLSPQHMSDICSYTCQFKTVLEGSFGICCVVECHLCSCLSKFFSFYFYFWVSKLRKVGSLACLEQADH